MTDYTRKSYRRSLRLQGYDYSQPSAYFVTICTKNRKCIFGQIVNYEMIVNAIGQIVVDFWSSLPDRYSNIELDEFTIMPNHVHCIIVITDFVETIHELSLQNQRRNMLLPKVMGYFKMNSAKAVNQLRSTAGTSVWQANYYEHIIRNEAELDRIRQYILNNPAKWGEDIDNLEGKATQEEIEFWRYFGRKDL